MPSSSRCCARFSVCRQRPDRGRPHKRKRSISEDHAGRCRAVRAQPARATGGDLDGHHRSGHRSRDVQHRDRPADQPAGAVLRARRAGCVSADRAHRSRAIGTAVAARRVGRRAGPVARWDPGGAGRHGDDGPGHHHRQRGGPGHHRAGLPGSRGGHHRHLHRDHERRLDDRADRDRATGRGLRLAARAGVQRRISVARRHRLGAAGATRAAKGANSAPDRRIDRTPAGSRHPDGADDPPTQHVDADRRFRRPGVRVLRADRAGCRLCWPTSRG